MLRNFLKIDDSDIMAHPTITDVHRVMNMIGEGRSGEMATLISARIDPLAPMATKLQLQCVLKPRDGGVMGWLIRIGVDGASETEVPALRQTSMGGFAACMLLGCPEEVRQDCILDDGTVDRVVTYFLVNGEANPDLDWIPFLAVFRPDPVPADVWDPSRLPHITSRGKRL